MDVEAETHRIQEFVQKGNYHAAINISISALNACRKNKEQAGVDKFIGIIRGVVNTMDDEFGTKH